jgi:hypothetical protein
LLPPALAVSFGCSRGQKNGASAASSDQSDDKERNVEEQADETKNLHEDGDGHEKWNMIRGVWYISAQHQHRPQPQFGCISERQRQNATSTSASRKDFLPLMHFLPCRAQ